jgi:hypothetical protein
VRLARRVGYVIGYALVMALADVVLLAVAVAFEVVISFLARLVGHR